MPWPGGKRVEEVELVYRADIGEARYDKIMPLSAEKALDEWRNKNPKAHQARHTQTDQRMES